jgi:predicted metal-dependent phosphoesterase TrpH
MPIKDRLKMGERWLKAELHSHCNLDPHDHRFCTSSPEALIRETAHLGYDVLAITCHCLDIWSPELAAYAAGLGITLIPGMEVVVAGRCHTLVYNFRTGAQNLDSPAKIRALRREDTLVIAPHPFFPAPTCLGRLLERNLDIFDAIEYSGFYTTRIDFNRRARRLALERRKPMVGCTDAHFLWQLGKTFTWIYAEPGIETVIRAVKRRLVKIETRPLSFQEVSRWWADALQYTLFPPDRAPRRQVGGFAPRGT